MHQDHLHPVTTTSLCVSENSNSLIHSSLYRGGVLRKRQESEHLSGRDLHSLSALSHPTGSHTESVFIQPIV